MLLVLNRKIFSALAAFIIVSVLSVKAQETSIFDLQTARRIEAANWQKVPGILKKIKKPVFKKQLFLVTSFGAKGSGHFDCFSAFKEAIGECHRNGGGKVVVPTGSYLINGPIHLLSNVILHLEKGAVLLFGTDPKFFTPLVKVRWEGVVCFNYSPLIYAYRQRNIAITGEGIIDGRTEGSWSLWKKDNQGKNQDKDKILLRQMGNDLVDERKRIFGNGVLRNTNGSEEDGDKQEHYLRPDLVQFYECKNILMDSVTLKSSPFWTVHPVFCTNITLMNLTIQKGTTNDDGIDPESSENVLIENCNISTNDDAISIKAGRDQDAWKRRGTKNIIIRNCVLNSDTANAFCIGSEMSGGVKNVFLEDCRSIRAFNGINFKCNLDRGGFIKNVSVRRFDFEKCLDNTILFQMDYHSWRGGNFPPEFMGFYFSDITCNQALNKSISISGVSSKAIKNVYLNRVNINKALKLPDINHAKGVLLSDVLINKVAL